MVRLSGPHARAALEALTGRAAPPPRYAARRALRDPADGAAIDDALVLFFPAPASFTGEDVAELHIHGGPAILARLVQALSALPGLAPAAAGAFTRRAYAHGKLDLTQAEGLADLVEAETEGQRVQALAQMRGGLSLRYEGWRAGLIEAMALLEAQIDFPDDDLALDHASARAVAQIGAVLAEMAAHLADQSRGERVREGYRIAILGPPNAGKSTLLNALARREAAIVSDIPGTTRDVIEVRLVLGGFPVWVADTAGLREARDAIEAEGVRRALARAEEADLRLGVSPAAQAPDAATLATLRPGDLLIRSKADLGEIPAATAFETLSLAATQSEGVAALEAALEARVVAALGQAEAAPLTRARHRAAVEEAHAALSRAQAALGQGAELAAEDVRLAARALGRITGRVDVEQVLDALFGQFCIGK